MDSEKMISAARMMDQAADTFGKNAQWLDSSIREFVPRLEDAVQKFVDAVNKLGEYNDTRS